MENFIIKEETSVKLRRKATDQPQRQALFSSVILTIIKFRSRENYKSRQAKTLCHNECPLE